MTQEDGTSLALGQRVVVHGRHRATVRYVGAVDGHEGLWVGLEWDDPGRGKHDGSHDGKTYFVSSVPGAATFVRYASLVKHGLSTGISLEEAVRIKYGTLKDVSAVANQVVRGDVERINEFLREDGALEVAGLASLRVSSVRDRLPFLRNVRELDLSDNLLSGQSWGALLGLAASLPSLRVLNVSNNRMGDVPIGDVGTEYRNDSVTTLALNGCMITSEDTVRWIAAAFPAVVELYLFDNRIRIGGTGPVCFPALQVLDLGQNGLASWADLDRSLGDLPSLRVLSLEGNGIDEVRVSADDRFPALEQLSVSRNGVADWDRGIQEMGLLPRLKQLRFTENPLCTDEPDVDRLIALGRLGSLVWINGSDVTAAERRDCELAFVRSLDRFVPGGVSLSVPLEARVAALERQYAVSRNASGAGSVACTSMEQSMVVMELVRGGTRVTTKRVPSSLTLEKLKRVADRLLARGNNDGVGDGHVEVVLNGLRFEAAALFGGEEERGREGGSVAEILLSNDRRSA